MHIHAIRQLTSNSHHNAFTGCRWFQGALYVSFRQGDAHVCTQGRIVVMRSRDDGVSYDTVAVNRGARDTRDAHLYTNGQRLFVCGFEYDHTLTNTYHAGCAYTDNGLNWSPWTRFTGCEGYIMWRPEYFRGKHYCSGYRETVGGKVSDIAWFESSDGLHWTKKRILHEGPDQPNECNLDFKPNGDIVMLARREHAARTPLLFRSSPPYEKWSKVELDVPLAGPALWLAGDDIWISGRWFVTPNATHVALFRIENDKPILKIVLPSGPGFDLSYMGVARHPQNGRRFALSYYSNHVAPADPKIDQWNHPQIFVVDAEFDAPYIQNWKVSDVVAGKTLRDATPGIAPAPGSTAPGTPATPGTPGSASLTWRDFTANDAEHPQPGMVDAHEMIAQHAGLVYFVADLDVGPTDAVALFLGYDGPIRVWLNGQQVFEGPGTNPATPDKTRLPIRFNHGHNRVTIALDTNGGKAWGIMARYEAIA